MNELGMTLLATKLRLGRGGGGRKWTRGCLKSTEMNSEIKG